MYGRKLFDAGVNCNSHCLVDCRILGAGGDIKSRSHKRIDGQPRREKNSASYLACSMVESSVRTRVRRSWCSSSTNVLIGLGPTSPFVVLVSSCIGAKGSEDGGGISSSSPPELSIVLSLLSGGE